MMTKAEEAMLDQIESMEELLSEDDIEYATIEGYTKNKKIRIGSLTAGDLIDFAEANEGDAKREAGLRLVCKSLVNSKGERYASDLKNIAVFRLKSHKATERIVKEILKLNGLGVKDAEKAKND